MDAQEIADAVLEMAEGIKAETAREIVDELVSGSWSQDEDDDTWEAGFAAAVEVIKSNYVLD